MAEAIQRAGVTAGQEPSTPTVQISVVLCCHDPARLPKLHAALASLDGQTIAPHEVLVVADGSEAVADEFDETEEVEMISLDSNRGLSTARNVGASAATGDVVAFLDDDAIAMPTWLAELARCYDDHDALAAGGRMVPSLKGRPLWLPGEFDWLIGGTHVGFADEVGIQSVRNTFGSNLSFDRRLFDELGGFADGSGRRGDRLYQAAETELCTRLHEHTGERVLYNPSAVVLHDIDQRQLRPIYLLRRAFWQGYSKQALARRDGIETEQAFLRQLVVDAIPRRAAEAAVIPVYVASVGLGYAYGILRHVLERSE